MHRERAKAIFGLLSPEEAELAMNLCGNNSLIPDSVVQGALAAVEANRKPGNALEAAKKAVGGMPDLSRR